MAKSYVRRKNSLALAALPPRELEQAAKKQLQVSVGAGEFQHRDPVAHLRESFQQSFDGLGRQAVQAQAKTGSLQEQAPGTSGVEEESSKAGVDARSASFTDSKDDALFQKTWMDGEYAPRHPGGEERFLQKFSETAFQRGKLSGAVLAGTGQVMLFSCLKRTFGRMDPQHIQQRKLFQASSTHSMMPGSPQSMAVYNKGYTDSAVALVTDVTANARRTVDSLTQLAQGAGNGSETLQKMYPFLDDSRERALIEQYQAMLAEKSLDPERERILSEALSRTRTLLADKHQMKQQFIAALNHISSSASTALAVFSQDAFRQALHERLRADTADRLPPEDQDDTGLPPDDLSADAPPFEDEPSAESDRMGGEEPKLGTDQTDECPGDSRAGTDTDKA